MNAIVEQQRPLWLEEVSARWREVLEDPNLRDLPYKIETNRFGKIKNTFFATLRNNHIYICELDVASLTNKSLNFNNLIF